MKTENFNNGDYKKLKTAYKNRKLLRYKFDGEKEKVIFFLSSGEKIESKRLVKAKLRQIVKLGETAKGKPGVAAESEYNSLTNSLKLMQKQHKAILIELTKAINGVFNEQITVKSTVNPSGSYSDSAGGVQSWDYNLISISK